MAVQVNSEQDSSLSDGSLAMNTDILAPPIYLGIHFITQNRGKSRVAKISQNQPKVAKISQ